MIKSKLRRILEENWNEFYKKYKNRIRPSVIAEVKKVMKCKDISNGYIELKCEDCGEIKKVGFTCKSRFCTSCGKVYVDNWVNGILGKLINVKHIHMVFTIPEELRNYFGRERDRLKLLPKCAAKAVTSWMYNQNKKEEFIPGIISVIHTFGRDLKWNPHVHMMVTEGGKGKLTTWRNFKYFSYEALRKRWQKILLDEIIKREGNKDSFRRLKNKIYKNNKDGFYVHAKNEIKSAKIAAKYIGRYVGRPAIAESRIIAYDGESVTFKYKRHEDNKEIIEKVPVFEFIKKVIIHIPDKNFKMVRYFGLYSRRCKDKDQFIKMIDKKIVQIKKSIEKWEYRILASFGVDPCKCSKCGGKMRFNDIVYPRYGSMREYFKDKFISEGKEKLENILEIYAVAKGVLYGKIKPTTT